jgi:hypothetical protein
MYTCSSGGYLVDGTSAIPTDATDLQVEGLPVVGCSELRCSACRVPVRNAPGLAFVIADELALDGFRERVTPPRIRPEDRTRAEWLVRLKARLRPEDSSDARARLLDLLDRKQNSSAEIQTEAACSRVSAHVTRVTSRARRAVIARRTWCLARRSTRNPRCRRVRARCAAR